MPRCVHLYVSHVPRRDLHCLHPLIREKLQRTHHHRLMQQLTAAMLHCQDLPALGRNEAMGWFIDANSHSIVAICIYIYTYTDIDVHIYVCVCGHCEVL